ncbi:Transcriptional regulator, GntR family / Aspartate aminotransferase [Aequoribacter fuscus]|jgi:GntR family transcriptional regulator/MocR family aminotransferase|uniref:Transcriptional regulator, GntR family / Aspartate aminotransferase n=1 Tax=Aequoribacter fuscus TaxID=2518989 RepID=F3KY98_9GAMM|nr:PLP-dependent aminotransferase family protein [Aequoribacter fuscus]EGG30954.1 Transcriptional regulator, GntR family / Aspartate aminotransferase [Aequoribacter fuscus]QHJ89315.1 PLP-dependent aminotransferase family protein [Aequoribacter fuscus]
MSSELLLQLDPDSKDSLQTQIVAKLSLAIAKGTIPLNSPMPSSRHLATQLGVGRNTVMLAYQRLLDDGLIVTHPRRGYFVNPDVERTRILERYQDIEPSHHIDWNTRLAEKPSQWQALRKPKDWQLAPYPFVYGQMSADLFPIQPWRECARDAVSVRAIKSWAVDRIDHDEPLLLEQIRTRLLPKRGIFVEDQAIMLTVGAQHALYMIAELLWRKASVSVGIENPGYSDLRRLIERLGAQAKPLAVDSDGLITDAQLIDCDYVCVTPSHQSPTTVTLPHARRQELLHSASQHDFVVIEDDYESEFNFHTRPEPALKSMDTEGRVIYVGSVSKTLAPGLRMGYIVASPELIEELRGLRRLMLRHPAANNQLSVALFLARGYHDALVSKLFKIYQKRRALLVTCLEQELPELQIQASLGGSALWIKAPDSIDTEQLALKAKELGVIVEPGAIHFAEPNPPKNFLRMGFSAIGEGSIAEGVIALRRAYRSL